MKTYLLICLALTSAIAGKTQKDTAYPFAVHYFRLEAQGERLKMAYMDVQPSTAAEATVVLLHGKNFNGAYWEQTAQELSRNGYRVIVPDQVGFGRSSIPEKFQYSFQQLAQNTKALLDSLKVTEIYLLGHSMGGMLATRFALMYPQTVKKLVLENPIGLEDWKTKVPYQPVDDWYRQELAQTYGKIKTYQMKSYYHNEWKPEYDPWLNMAAAQLKRNNYPLIAWNSALVYDMIYTQPVLYEFGNLVCPTLLIIGQKDRTALNKDKAPEGVRETLGHYPSLGKAAAKDIKNAKLVELGPTGHIPHIEDFGSFIEPLLDFLKD